MGDPVGRHAEHWEAAGPWIEASMPAADNRRAASADALPSKSAPAFVPGDSAREFAPRRVLRAGVAYVIVNVFRSRVGSCLRLPTEGS